MLVKVVEAMDGELDSVVISELWEYIYYAKLRVKRDGELIDIDSRPSDAIAVAVTRVLNSRSTRLKSFGRGNRLTEV